MSQLANSSGSRRVGLRLSLAAASTARLFWGPFLAGERIGALRLYQDSVAVAGDVASVEVKAFGARPPDTDDAFTSNGRFLTVEGDFASAPAVPLRTARIDISVQHTVRSDERWIGVRFASVPAMQGSVWLIMNRQACSYDPPVGSATGGEKD